MFNPSPRIQAFAIAPFQACYVIDDALADPQHWVDLAAKHRDAFLRSPHNAFPGPELEFSPEIIERFTRFFDTHVRSALGGRRTTSSMARLSIATCTADELAPSQWICHTDSRGLPPDMGIGACVVYLFRNPQLGGTAFYAPARPLPEIAAMMQSTTTLPPAEFSARYGIARGYMTASNAWFRKLLAIEPRWNRMIFYSGSVLHSADLIHPELLDPHPARGRLTINGFFNFRRKLGA